MIRAIDAVERALTIYGPPVYVRHEIVHNKYVVESLKKKGAIFVEELDEIPDTDAPVIFSAHGVPKSVPAEAAERKMFAIDATCPLVTKVHREAELHYRRGHRVILVGHAGHPEVVGTLGQLPSGAVILVENIDDVNRLADEQGRVLRQEPLAFVTQTTLSVDDTQGIVDALKARFPNIVSPHKEDICYATTNRQEAVKQIAHKVDALLVVGLGQFVELAAPEGGRASGRAARTASSCCAPATSIGRRSATSAPSASPPAPRRPRCWSRRSSTPSRSAMRSRSRPWRPCQENMFFPLPRELRPAQELGQAAALV